MNESMAIFDFFKSRKCRNSLNEAVFDYDNRRHYTYTDLFSRAFRLVSFYEELGLKPGDRVAIYARNGMIYFDVYYAFLYSKVISTSYNVKMSYEELILLLQEELPRVIFFDGEFINQIEKVKTAYPNCQFICLDQDEYYESPDIFLLEEYPDAIIL